MATADLKRVLGEITEVGPEAMAVLTGGEPTLRPDLPELAEHASGLGLMVVVGTNGMSLTTKRVRTLQQAGVEENHMEMLAEDAMLQQRLLVNNPRDVSYADALAIYRAAYGGPE